MLSNFGLDPGHCERYVIETPDFVNSSVSVFLLLWQAVNSIELEL